MSISQEQLDDLKSNFGPNVFPYEESGIWYVYIPGLKMPRGCVPESTDVLFCPSPHSGYNNRLFFKERVRGTGSPNWQGSHLILGKQWEVYSFRDVQPGRYSDMVFNHLRGLMA